MVELRQRKPPEPVPVAAPEGNSAEVKPLRAPKPPAASKAAPKRRTKAASAQAVNLKDLDLLGVVSKHGAVVKLAVKEWAERYPGDKPGATAELFTLLIKACGCPYTVPPEEVDEGEVDDLVTKISEVVKEEGVADCFAGKGSKTFNIHFEELWDQVVQEAHTREFLFDDYLMDKLVSLFTAMSCSPIRPFRHCATVAATQLVTSWINAMSSIMNARNTAQRQLTAEEKKSKGRHSERAATLKRSIELDHKHTQDLQAVISNVFQAVFAHRFRDISPQIRAVVIRGIGGWVCALPAVYLKDQFLKYLAWALSDKEASVRQAGVMALQRLYQDQRNVPQLEGFTERFRRRFIELIYDVDLHVAVSAVKLLMRLQEVEAVGWEKMLEVYGLLIDQHYELRHSAADLVARQLEQLGISSLETAKRGKKARAKEPTEQEAQLAGLLCVLRELSKTKEDFEEGEDSLVSTINQIPEDQEPLEQELIAYVVEALTGRVPVLEDWSALVEAIESDAAGATHTSADISNLLNLVVVCIRLACGSLSTVISGQTSRRKPGRPKASSPTDSAKDITLVLMKSMPKLIRKFQGDSVLVAPLIGLVKEMKLDLFLHKKDEKGFEALLQVIVDVFGKHTHKPTILECISALNFCAENGKDKMQDRAELSLNKCLQDMMKTLKDGWGRLNKLGKKDLAAAVAAAEDGDVDPVFYNVEASLMRLYHLQMASSKPLASQESLAKLVNSILESGVKGKTLTPGILKHALQNRFAILAWMLHGLKEAPDDREAIDRFVITRDDFVRQLMAVGDSTVDPSLCRHVFQMQSDLYLLLGRALTSKELPSEIGHTPTDDDLIKYWALGKVVITTALAEESEAGETVDENSASSATGLRPVEVILHAGKLLTNGVVENPSWLTGQLVSYLAVLGTKVKDVVKDILAGLPRESLPAVYLDALEAAWGRAEEAEEADFETAAKQVQNLSFRIMQMYRKPTAANRQVAAEFLRRGIRYVCLDLPSRVGFLGYGLGNFINRLSKESAQEAAIFLEKQSAKPLKSCNDPDVAELVDNFKSHLQAASEGEAAEDDAAPGDEEGAAQDADQQQEQEQEPEEEEEHEEQEEEQEEMHLQPTEEQLFVAPRFSQKRPAEEPLEDVELPSKPRRRRV